MVFAVHRDRGDGKGSPRGRQRAASRSPARRLRRLIAFCAVVVLALLIAPYVIAPFYRVDRSGLDADALALGDRPAGAAHRRAAQPHRTGAAARRDRRRGRQLLPQSRHRPRRHPRGAANSRTTTSPRRAAPPPSPSRWPRTCSSGPGTASCARRWKFRWRCGSTWCCRSGGLLEIYLNIAEWGPNGEFGAEAGARWAFGVPARNLNAAQAAELAAILPNPVRTQRPQPEHSGPPAGRALRAPRRRPSGARCLRLLPTSVAGIVLL